MDHHILLVIGGNLIVVIFFGGMAYARLKQNGKELAGFAKAKELLWKRLDELNGREERHYRKLLVALTVLASAGNPQPNEKITALLQAMSEEKNG